MPPLTSGAGVHDEEGRLFLWVRSRAALMPACHGPHRRALCGRVGCHHVYLRDLPGHDFFLSFATRINFLRQNTDAHVRKAAEDFLVGFGDHHLEARPSPVDTNEVRLRVEKIIVHPEYRL